MAQEHNWQSQTSVGDRICLRYAYRAIANANKKSCNCQRTGNESNDEHCATATSDDIEPTHCCLHWLNRACNTKPKEHGDNWHPFQAVDKPHKIRGASGKAHRHWTTEQANPSNRTQERCFHACMIMLQGRERRNNDCSQHARRQQSWQGHQEIGSRVISKLLRAPESAHQHVIRLARKIVNGVVARHVSAKTQQTSNALRITGEFRSVI